MVKNIQSNKAEDDKFDFYYGIWKYLWWAGCIVSFVLGIVWNEWTFVHTIILLLGITLIYVLILFTRKYCFKSYPYKEMRNLVVETLKQIGCQPEIDKNDENRVLFLYQGENFFISIENESLIAFYDTWWGRLDFDDPNVDNLKEAINLVNVGNIPKVLYSIDEENKSIGVHSMYKLFLKKELPAIPDLFKTILYEFFQVQKEVRGRFSTMTEEKMERSKKGSVKVKGFTKDED